MFYLTELFSGRFVDRNGKAVTFSLGVNLANIGDLSNLRISPELAGKVVSVLVEFLGDRVFQVPYYSQAILDVYKSKRTNATALTANGNLLTKLTNAVVAGSLNEADAKELGIPVYGDLDWTVLFKPDQMDPTKPEDPKFNSTIVGSQVCRLLESRTTELDSELRRLKSAEAALDAVLAAIGTKTSDLQTVFTIHFAGIQTDFIKCMFLPEDRLTCDVTNIGSDKDYASLVGKLVSFAAETAETNVRALVGGAVRGISLLSLDNEVVAEVIAAAAATAARKAAESFAYTVLYSYIKDQSIDVTVRRSKLDELRAIHERLTNET